MNAPASRRSLIDSRIMTIWSKQTCSLRASARFSGWNEKVTDNNDTDCLTDDVKDYTVLDYTHARTSFKDDRL